MPNKPSVLDIKSFFLLASAKAFAKGGETDTNYLFPGHEINTYAKGHFGFVDMWCTSPGSNKSTGTTTVWYENNVVLTVQYGGWYFPEVVSFLKSALLAAYSSDLWCGGRGPRLFEKKDSTLVYRNEHLNRFSGIESIVDTKGDKLMGEHLYSVVFFT